MADKAIEVEVAFAKPHAQVLVRVTVLTGESVAQAIKKIGYSGAVPRNRVDAIEGGNFW
jgi:Uncharacterised protein family (UPF0125).